MVLESVGILISMRPFNERDVIAQVFTRDWGIVVGMIKGALGAKKNKPVVGQIGDVSWNARLDSQLGVFHWAASKNLAADLMSDYDKLKFMNAAFELLGALLPEREAYQGLYQETVDMLQNLGMMAENTYLGWEMCLLRDLGYAMDLTHCSGCGGTDNLNFISPRTARAVCNQCAQPYLNKLYKMPVNLGVTYRFLENVCAQQGVKMPLGRCLLRTL